MKFLMQMPPPTAVNEDGGPKISMLLAIAKPDDIALIEGFTDNDDALRVANLMKMIDRDELRAGVVRDLDMWPLVPVLQAAGAVMPDQDWLAAKDAALTQRSFVSLSPIVLAAVTHAADNRRVAETILLTNWLLQTGPLETINTEDLATLVTALRNIGQEDVAKALVKVLRAHLLIGLLQVFRMAKRAESAQAGTDRLIVVFLNALVAMRRLGKYIGGLWARFG